MTALADGGIGRFALPVPSLAFMVVAAVAGVAAAIGPSRRATELNLLGAIASE